jgi:chromate transporter
MGLAGFGGGLAVISQVRRRLVDRTRIFSDGEFLDCLALAQALPGGASINLFTQLGFQTGGTLTALLSTIAFVLPSAVLMGVLGASYSTLDSLPRVATVLASLDASVLAIITAAAIEIGRRMTRRTDFVLAAAVGAAVSLRLTTVLEAVLLVVVGALALSGRQEKWGSSALSAIALAPSKGLALVPMLAPIFLQIGVSLFGGGLAMIPMLDRLLVGPGWLSPKELHAAITLSQLTPGPVATACTFAGYRLAGTIGALTATLEVFAPPFLLSVIAARSARRFRDNGAVRAILAALGPASVGLIAAAAVSFGSTGPHGLEFWVFAAGGLILLVMFHAPPLLVLIGTGVLRALATVWIG